MDTCASAAKIARTDVDSRKSGDTTFEREVSSVVVKMEVDVDKDTEQDTLEKEKNDLQGC